MNRINMNKLKKIIREELKLIREGAEHEAVAKNSAACSKLLKAIETFNQEASEKMKSAAQEMGLNKVEEKIKFAVGSPLEFIDPIVSEEPKLSATPKKLDSSSQKVAVKPQVKKTL